jgi:ABC-type thiamine transport system ATPase subunit
VLGTILATYSDEKLKSIQLSLEEKQKIRAISREEVEKSLRQSGLASMADRLKGDIEKGIA